MSALNTLILSLIFNRPINQFFEKIREIATRVDWTCELYSPFRDRI
jgi:hypothetical protein